MNYIKLYLRFVTVYMKGKMEYHSALLLELIANAILIGIYFAGFYVIFQNFETIAGWNKYEVLFMFTTSWLSYSFSCFFFWGPMRSMGELVSLLTDNNYGLKNFCDYPIQIYGKGMQFLLIFIVPYAFTGWTAEAVGYYGICLLAAFVIFSSITIITGAVSFWSVKSEEILSCGKIAGKRCSISPGILFITCYCAGYGTVCNDTVAGGTEALWQHGSIDEILLFRLMSDCRIRAKCHTISRGTKQLEAELSTSFAPYFRNTASTTADPTWELIVEDVFSILISQFSHSSFAMLFISFLLSLPSRIQLRLFAPSSELDSSLIKGCFRGLVASRALSRSLSVFVSL